MDSEGRDHPALPAVEAGTAGWALYRLLAWLSPAFPIGAFSYSHGLEAAVEGGAVHDRASLQSWIAAIVDRGQRPDRRRHPARCPSCGQCRRPPGIDCRQPARPRLPRDRRIGARKSRPGRGVSRYLPRRLAGPISRPLGGNRPTSLLCRCGRRGHGAGRHLARRRASRLSAGDGGQSRFRRVAPRHYRPDRRAAHPCGARTRRDPQRRRTQRPAIRPISAARPLPSTSPRWRTKPNIRGCSAHERWQRATRCASGSAGRSARARPR